MRGQIPWVRGIINEIHAPGIVLNPEDQRFLQPLIGKELLFKDALSVTIRKVVINPHNRRVVAVVVLGRFPDPLRKDQNSGYRGESNPERLVVLPVHLILYLTRSAGFIQINSVRPLNLKIMIHPVISPQTRTGCRHTLTALIEVLFLAE